MRFRETCLLATVLLIVAVMFARLTRVRYFTQALDEAYFLESIDTTYSTGHPQTMLTASVVEALETVIIQPASTVCEADLAHPRSESISIYEKHAFPILYPLALMRFAFSSLTILVLCTVVAFPCLLACVYVFARRFGCPAWLAGVLALFTAAHPAWSYAALGQFYPDKLFPFFCLIYLGLLYEYLSGKRSGPWMLITWGILAASTSERSAIMLVAATGVALAWYSWRRGLRRADLAPLALTISLALYVYGYMHFVQVNYDYVSFGKSAVSLLKEGLTNLPPDSRKFLAINVAVLLPFSLAGGLWSVVAAGSLLPNLLGTVGGAEKLGWMTHYHSAYFPFLLFATIVGAATLYRRSPRIAATCATLAAALAAVFLLLNPISPAPLLDLSPRNFHETALAQMVEFQADAGSAQFLRGRANFYQSLARLIPAESEVSTTEFYMPALYEHGVHKMRFYPLGIGSSRYVIVPYVETPTGKVTYTGHISYTRPGVAEETNQCLTTRLEATYRVLQLLPEFQGGGTAVLELK